VRAECERGELVYLPIRDKLLHPQWLSIVRRASGSVDGLVVHMAETLRAAVAAMGQVEKP
jgi:hypothetical protein